MLLGAASLLAPFAGAQSYTKLLLKGDVIPFGAGTATVASIYNVDVNNSGQWLCEFDTDEASDVDNAIMMNGALIHMEGTSLGFPASHAGAWVYDSYVDSMDINDNGDRLMLFNAGDPTATVPDKKLIIWTDGGSGTPYTLIEEGVTLCTVAGEPVGAVWDSVNEVWQNNNNEMIVADRSNSDADDMLVHMTHDGAGTILAQTVFAIDNVNHAVAFPPSNGVHATNVQGFTTSKANIALNNAGQKMFYVDDDHNAAGGDTNLDSHYYIDTTEIAWEGDDAPTAGIFPYNHLSSAEVDINDSGSWIAVWDDDNPDTTQDFFILKDGVVMYQEGQAPPGVAGGFVMTGSSFGPVQLSSFGEITWICDWDDPNTDIDSGLFRDNTMLIQEGVTSIDSLIVDTISTSADGMAVNDDGTLIVIELTMAGGLEGLYMIEMNPISTYCYGDGTGSTCPCGNISGTGEGCMNSSAMGGLLGHDGTSSIALDDFVLTGSQLPANKPALFFTGTMEANGGLGNLFGDGLLCVSGPIIRLDVVFTNLSGECSSTSPIASTIGATLGQDSYFQLWFRDPAGVCGAGFNTTNALSLTWR